MLSSAFVSGAIRTLRNPTEAAARAEPVSRRLGEWAESRAPWLPTDPTSLARAGAAAQLAGAALLATGRAPRLAATVLAGSLLPGTIAGLPFWRAEDPAARASQRDEFLTRLGLLGAVLLTAVDTRGRPGIGWRAEHAAGHAADQVRGMRKALGRTVRRTT